MLHRAKRMQSVPSAAGPHRTLQSVLYEGGLGADSRHTLCSQNRSVSLFTGSSLVNEGWMDDADVTELLQDKHQG